MALLRGWPEGSSKLRFTIPSGSVLSPQTNYPAKLVISSTSGTGGYNATTFFDTLNPGGRWYIPPGRQPAASWHFTADTWGAIDWSGNNRHLDYSAARAGGQNLNGTATPETQLVYPESPVTFQVGSFWITKFSTTADQIIYSVSNTKWVAIEDNTAGGRIYFYDNGVFTYTNLTLTGTVNRDNVIIQQLGASSYRVFCNGVQSSADYSVSGFDSVATLASCSAFTEDGVAVHYVTLFNEALDATEIGNLYTLGTPGANAIQLSDMRTLRLGVSINGAETPANAEIAMFNPIARFAEIYVNVPSLPTALDTQIDLYYGGSTAPTIANQPTTMLALHSSYIASPVASVMRDRSGFRNTMSFSAGTSIYDSYTDFPYVGDNSFYCTGGAYATMTAASTSAHPFNLGNGDFTIDWVMRPASDANSTGRHIIYSHAAGGSGMGIEVFTQATTGEVVLRMSSVNTSFDLANYASFGNQTLSAWEHYAIVRSGSTVYLWKNGAIVNTVNVGAASLYCLTSQPSRLLGGGGLGNYKGHFDMFRIIKGRALWTSLGEYQAPSAKFSRQEAIDVVGQQAARTVWDEDYLSVFHMNYCLRSTANAFLDSGRYGCNATLSFPNAESDDRIDIDDVFNMGLRTVTINDMPLVNAPADPTLIYPSATTSFFDYSYEVIAKAGTTNTAAYATIIGHREDAGRGSLRLTPTGFLVHAPQGDTTNILTAGSAVPGWGTTPVKFMAGLSCDDGSNRIIYRDGVSVASAAYVAISTSNYGVSLFHDGSFIDNTKSFVGTIFEARVSRTIRSPEWMRLFDLFESDEINEVTVPVDVNEMYVDLFLMELDMYLVEGSVVNTAFAPMEIDIQTVQVDPYVLGITFGAMEVEIETGSIVGVSFEVPTVALAVYPGNTLSISSSFELPAVNITSAMLVDVSMGLMDAALATRQNNITTLDLSFHSADVDISVLPGNMMSLSLTFQEISTELALVHQQLANLSVEGFALDCNMRVVHGRAVAIAGRMQPMNVSMSVNHAGSIAIASSFALPDLALATISPDTDDTLSYNWNEQWLR